nr:MAG TPA: hypothetical protein [Caudoviricetes sp.]
MTLLSTTLVQKSGNKITAKTPETVAHKYVYCFRSLIPL